MKLSKKMKKSTALFLVAFLVLPSLSDLFLADLYAADVSTGSGTETSDAADGTTGTDSGGELTEAEKEAEALKELMSATYNYKFYRNSDLDAYDYDINFTYNGETYSGLYKNDLKKTEDNTSLPLEELGTPNDPYIILEIAPDETATEIRAFAAEASIWGLTQAKRELVKYTDSQIDTVHTYITSSLSQEQKDMLVKNYEDKAAGEAIGSEEAEALCEEIREATQVNVSDDDVVYFIQLSNLEIDEVKEINVTDEALEQARSDARDYCFYQQYGESYVKLLTGGTNYKDFEDFYKKYDYVYGDIYGSNSQGSWGVIGKAYTPQSSTDRIYERLADIESHLPGFEAEYKIRVQQAIDNALAQAESNRVRDEVVGASFHSAYQYEWSYKVENGKFLIETENRDDAKTPLGTGETTQAYLGQYQVELKNDWNNSRIVNSNLFIKGCLDLAYYKDPDDENRQRGYYDQYIFAGWKYLDPETGEITSLTEETDLSMVTELYTTWTAREYESNDSYVVTTGGNNDVLVDYGAFTIHLPSCIASKRTTEELYNDPKNQLSFYTIQTYRKLGPWINLDSGYIYDVETDEVNEIDGMDFSFDREQYKTGADLLKVAPKLMSDIDYYIATYNCSVVTENGEKIVKYYPYNVQVITITPDELNKMVYYSYAENSWDESEYHSEEECSYIDKFFDDVDFIYITNGNTQIFRSGISTLPARNKFPVLYSEDGETYYKDKLNYSSKFSAKSDLEWQVIMKMYMRTLNETQKRRVSYAIDRTTYQSFGGVTLQGTPNGIANFTKFIMLLFQNTDPQLIYKCYVKESDADTDKYHFDKLKGVVRDEEEAEKCNTYYTGKLYNQTAWSQRTLFPYEVIGLDHEQSLEGGGLGSEYPWDNQISGLQDYFTDVGLSYNFEPTTIVNNYARTFIGGTQMGQGFADKSIISELNPTNNSGVNNTSMMFDYFAVMRPRAVVNGQLSTENAIEFMVQNVRNRIVTEYDRRIEIVNDEGDDDMEIIDGIRVEKVFASEDTQGIQYTFYTSIGGFYVTEYYWTPKFQSVDNDNMFAGMLFRQFTNSKDPAIKWIKIDPKILDGVGLYMTDAVETDSNHLVTNRKSITELNSDGKLLYNESIDKTAKTVYEFIAEAKPQINDATVKGHFVVVVQRYKDKATYLSGGEPISSSVTMKNVTIEKFQYLFNLD